MIYITSNPNLLPEYVFNSCRNRKIIPLCTTFQAPYLTIQTLIASLRKLRDQWFFQTFTGLLSLSLKLCFKMPTSCNPHYWCMVYELRNLTSRPILIIRAQPSLEPRKVDFSARNVSMHAEIIRGMSAPTWSSTANFSIKGPWYFVRCEQIDGVSKPHRSEFS